MSLPPRLDLKTMERVTAMIKAPEAIPPAALMLRPAVTAFGSLQETGEFSDFAIICGDRKWKVHKAILCPQSAYFRSACAGQYSEAGSGQLDLSCEDEAALDAMINYMYHGCCSDVADSHNSPADAPFHLKVHILTDKYDIALLVEDAAYAFLSIADTHCYERDFCDWLVAVQEQTPQHSMIRTELFNLIRDRLVALLRNETDDSTPRRTAEAGTGTLNDVEDEGVRVEEAKKVDPYFREALIKCPKLAASLLVSISRTWRPLASEDITLPVEDGTSWGEEFMLGRRELRVRCRIASCGIAFAWPTDLNGNEAKCPRCGQVVFWPMPLPDA
ncbi:hypothetical protein LTR95_016859 [Oleoguttula sp. CCFEE 5521]